MFRMILVSVCLLPLLSTAAQASDGGHDDHGHDVAAFEPTRIMEYTATILFGVAVLHTFCVSWFRKLAHRYKEGSMPENVFHLLGEVEAVFLLWSAVLITAMTALGGWSTVISYIDERNYTEPMFVFVIMVIAATAPIIRLVDDLIRMVSQLIPLDDDRSFFVSALIVGPLLGSFVTEPAAMTVTALVLKRQYYDRGITRRLMYATLGTLFVNVSIGGTLTHFAAPPVLMVAGTWGWDMPHMFGAFGWKAAVAVSLNALILAFAFKRELQVMTPLADSEKHGEGEAPLGVPHWIVLVHVLFLAFTVVNAHHSKLFMGGFLFFLAFAFVTQEYQEKLKLTESLLVGGFLAGLVTLGGLQSWWLEPLLGKLSELPLFIGATGLTAVTDNAALTYLGSQVHGLSDGMKYALVAGAVTGGGLTVIANAPNPAGFSVLNPSFTSEEQPGGISPLWLLCGAALPTLVAALCLWFLPSF